MKTQLDLTHLVDLQCPKSCSDLVQTIHASGMANNCGSFERLTKAISATPGFLSNTLPFIWSQALSASRFVSDLPLLDAAGSLTLTQRQCVCILANAFLCTFTQRPSENCRSGPNLPSINFDELYGGDIGWGAVEVAKLRMLFDYFAEMKNRNDAGDSLERTVKIIRTKAINATIEDWKQCTDQLIQPVMHGLGESIDDAKDMLKVDFANSIIGGAAIAYGCVQEEIMFCEFPEMIVSRLIFPMMEDDEAILIIGAEQFSTHTGYASSLEYAGPYMDSTQVQNGCMSSYVVAIDAMDLRMRNFDEQYEATSIVRELTKSWAGFGIAEAPASVATGNWGCGAFGGDAELKSVLQWLACSRAGKTINYFPFDNEDVFRSFPELAALLVSSCASVKDVASFLFDALRPGSVYQQIQSEFGG